MPSVNVDAGFKPIVADNQFKEIIAQRDELTVIDGGRMMPPSADVLGNPLVVTDLPTHKMPKESLSDRILRFLAQMRIGAQSSETTLRWKVQDMTSTVMASLSPSVTLSPGSGRKRSTSSRRSTSRRSARRSSTGSAWPWSRWGTS